MLTKAAQAPKTPRKIETLSGFGVEFISTSLRAKRGPLLAPRKT